MSAAQLERAFILHRRDFSNTSLIVDLFSARHGRLPLMAKGAKRGRAPQAHLLQPFQPLWLAWSGRGEVRTLTRVEAAGRALVLTGTALYCGLYVNELLVRLLGRDDPHEGLFQHYQLALQALCAGDDIDSALRRFELRLLDEIGYRVVLDREADNGRAVRPECHYRYIAAHGLVSSPVSQGPGMVSGETLQLLNDGAPLTDRHAREARDLMRIVLAPYLGERPLRSRALFRRPRPSGPTATPPRPPARPASTRDETSET